METEYEAPRYGGLVTANGSATGTVAQGQQNTVTVRVQPSGAVVGRVLRANGSTPAPGAELTLQLLPNRGSLVLYARGDGTFDIRGVPLGAFTVRVRDAFSGGVALIEGKSLTTNGQTVDLGDVVMDESTDLIAVCARIMRFYSHESCGQCTPCREGTGWLARICTKLADGKGRPGDVDLLASIAHGIAGNTICPLGEAAAWPMLGFLTKFRPEFALAEAKAMISGSAA